MKRKKLYCANCGCEIEDYYLKVCDNYLQVKYFDSEDDNVFCSDECLKEALTVETFDSETRESFMDIKDDCKYSYDEEET